MVRCSHDGLTLHTGVEINGVGEFSPPKVKHLTNSWGIERLHSLLSRLRHLYHQVLFKSSGAGTCRKKDWNLHIIRNTKNLNFKYTTIDKQVLRLIYFVGMGINSQGLLKHCDYTCRSKFYT